MSFVAVAIALSAAQGVMAYKSGQAAAASANQQAKQAQLLAANRAQVIRNNAIGQAQDEQFQSGVARFNQQESMIEASRQADLMDRDIATQLASQEAGAGRRGLSGASFEDLLSAESLRLEREESDFLYSAGQQGYQAGKSADLGDLRGRRTIEMGQYESSLAISEGRYQAYGYKSQAQQAKIQGIGGLVGGFAQAASTLSTLPKDPSGTPAKK